MTDLCNFGTVRPLAVFLPVQEIFLPARQCSERQGIQEELYFQIQGYHML